MFMREREVEVHHHQFSFIINERRGEEDGKRGTEVEFQQLHFQITIWEQGERGREREDRKEEERSGKALFYSWVTKKIPRQDTLHIQQRERKKEKERQFVDPEQNVLKFNFHPFHIKSRSSINTIISSIHDTRERSDEEERRKERKKERRKEREKKEEKNFTECEKYMQWKWRKK